MYYDHYGHVMVPYKLSHYYYYFFLPSVGVPEGVKKILLLLLLLSLLFYCYLDDMNVLLIGQSQVVVY